MGTGRWKHPELNEINLGDITDQEQGESRDDTTAAKFYHRDAERGDAAAQLNLAEAGSSAPRSRPICGRSSPSTA